MPSRKHRDYLEQAHRHGHTEAEAEDALRRVRDQSGGEYVPDLYQRALTVLDAGSATDRQRTDADRILANYGMSNAPEEMRQVMGHLFGQIGPTVDAQGRPAHAGVNEVFADVVDGLPGAERLARPVPDPVPSGPAFSGHHTTFVIPERMGLSEYDIPVLVLAAQEAWDIPRLPLPTSLHRIGNQLMGYARARSMEELEQITVSDAWVQAVIGYEGAAKIIVAQEPLPAGVSTEHVPAITGVHQPGLPGWIEDLVRRKISAAVRDVPVSDGADPLNIHIMPHDPIRLPEWAQSMV